MKEDNKQDNNNNNSNIQTYLEIECEQSEEGPSFCIEFPISCRVFIIALALAGLEKKCDEEQEE